MTTLNFGRKANAEVKHLEAGQEFIGTFQAESTRDWFDKKDGEMKVITQFHFMELNTNGTEVGPVILFADAGLKNAAKSALLTVNETVMIKKLEKTELDGGRTVNNYEIYKTI